LQISAESLYERAGILDPNDADRPTVVDAIANDDALTKEQKQTLIAVYRSFTADDRQD
jgi:hypothetical protein